MAGVLASTAAAIGILDKAVSITQKLANNSDELDKATLKLELANLMVELANAKIEAITTQTLLFDAEQKNKQLEDQLKDKSTFIFKDNVYWKAGDEVPFCPHCYETNNTKRHLQRVAAMKGRYSWICSVCKITVRCV
ncbi:MULTISPECIES: hypothetical protein [Enterobacter]|uniref:hypothetical protein n=1 Tax=Enterobacter TaxID=547 RepID=UPI002983371E|nr:hypothetical protein [Enterobacter bugandensis]ELY4305941.1 hypothetical protein [Cronobacter sakazakii]MCM7800442.1 hypothetical protein [Enterobacter hormaechei]HCA7336413.1 hypothetical protein [Klebsiella pneumoniae]HEG2114828.1 hypothetical protein [Enterobacter kobei]HCD4760724.1 hypothetical protein [Enterobacter hormaechei]